MQMTLVPPTFILASTVHLVVVPPPSAGRPPQSAAGQSWPVGIVVRLLVERMKHVVRFGK